MQPSKEARKQRNSIVADGKDSVKVEGDILEIGWIRPDVNWYVDRVMEEEDPRGQRIHKVVAASVLNSFFKIKLFHWILWRWYYYWKGYTWDALIPAIELIKKKIQPESYWMNMVFLTELMTSWKTLTKKEAEEYRQEHMKVALQVSEKNRDGH